MKNRLLVLATILLSNCFTSYNVQQDLVKNSSEFSNITLINNKFGYTVSKDSVSISNFSNEDNGRDSNGSPTAGIHIEVLSEKEINRRMEWYTYLDKFLLCSLPCAYEREFELEINYRKYDVERKRHPNDYLGIGIPASIARAIPKEVLGTEKIKYKVNQFGFLFFGIDKTDSNSLLNTLSERDGSIYNNFPSIFQYLSANVKNFSDQNLEAKKLANQAVGKNIDAMDNKSCKKFYTLRESLDPNDKDIYEKVNGKLIECLKIKTNKYIAKEYPFLKGISEKQIYTRFNKTDFFVFELFHSAFLAKSPETGFKLSGELFSVKKSGDKKLVISIILDNKQSIAMEFTQLGEKVLITSVIVNREVNPARWEEEIPQIFKILYSFPKDAGAWDWDLIDSF
jgi:hypothetical protein